MTKFDKKWFCILCNPNIEMGDVLRRKVLQGFKRLHRTRLNTFKGDVNALEVARKKINEEYRKYKSVTNPAAIEELNKFAQEVEHEIRTTVVQAVQTEPGKFELRITNDTALLHNVPYKDSNNKESHFKVPPKTR